MYFQNLESWLKENPKGQFVLKSYEKYKILTSQAQKYLLDEIYCKVHNSKWNFGNKTCSTIANKIVQLFPNEVMEIYYVAPKSTGDQQTHSKGMLPNKFRNSKRLFQLEKEVRKEHEKSIFDSAVEGQIYFCLTRRKFVSLFKMYSLIQLCKLKFYFHLINLQKCCATKTIVT